jgi:CRISPR-associated protein (TIGR03984 family)
MSLPTTLPTPDLAGCDLRPLDAADCDRHLAWLLGEPADPPDGAADFRWALAHCDDGVTWGVYEQQARSWRLGSEVVAAVSPTIRRESLQELRLFGELAEVLIWRTDEGLSGRLLRDRGDAPEALRPFDESRILRGDSASACRDGFSHVADRAGAEQVVPLVVTDDDLQARRARLAVRHYCEQDAETGAVRIAATRLVSLRKEEDHET